jgi:trans-aconitate methyltransferase
VGYREATVGGRERRLVFGEVADDYDEVRAGYPAELVDAVFDYLGGAPAHIVEVGAGTGKATAAFRARGIPMTCVEPDPAMAAVLRTAHPGVTVEGCGFEDWTPPAGGVPLLICAQAWHWVDEQRRMALAHRALAPDGVLALFGHQYAFADSDVEADVHAAYARHAPELLDPPDRSERPAVDYMTDELTGSALFTDVRTRLFETVVPYPTQRYRRLLLTFSPHRMLPVEQRTALHDAIDEVIRAHGGVLRQRVDTPLVLGRRVPV